jgi:hypothetical protein
MHLLSELSVPIRKSGVMARNCCGYRLQSRLKRSVRGPKFRENRAVDRMLASSFAVLQHLLEAVSVFAEVMQHPSQTRKICKVDILRSSNGS